MVYGDLGKMECAKIHVIDFSSSQSEAPNATLDRKAPSSQIVLHPLSIISFVTEHHSTTHSKE